MRTRTGHLVIAAAAASLTALVGCQGERSDKPPRQFFPDMDDSPKWKPQTETEFFADGRSMRQPVVGTVAFARRGVLPPSDAPWADLAVRDRADLLREDDALYTGKLADGRFVDRIPLPVTEALIARGAERFNIYCAACHGYQGEGGGTLADGSGYGGMVGRRWAYAVPTYHDPKYVQKDHPDNKFSDGFLFDTARHGVVADDVRKMPGYAHALSPRDAWAIVAYIRVLQASHAATLEDVPTERRRELEIERPGQLSMGQEDGR